jgi:high-affinity Fe2+/Pb2+ permease
MSGMETALRGVRRWFDAQPEWIRWAYAWTGVITAMVLAWMLSFVLFAAVMAACTGLLGH